MVKNTVSHLLKLSLSLVVIGLFVGSVDLRADELSGYAAPYHLDYDGNQWELADEELTTDLLDFGAEHILNSFDEVHTVYIGSTKGKPAEAFIQEELLEFEEAVVDELDDLIRFVNIEVEPIQSKQVGELSYLHGKVRVDCLWLSYSYQVAVFQVGDDSVFFVMASSNDVSATGHFKRLLKGLSL